MQRIALLALVAGVALFAFACGGSGGAGDTPAAQPSHSADASSARTAEAVAVAISGFTYQPATLEIAAGTTVTWTNSDRILHTVTTGADGQPDGALDGQMAQPGVSFTHTFTEPGRFPYFCSRHPFMQGEVIVH